MEWFTLDKIMPVLAALSAVWLIYHLPEMIGDLNAWLWNRLRERTYHQYAELIARAAERDRQEYQRLYGKPKD